MSAIGRALWLCINRGLCADVPADGRREMVAEHLPHLIWDDDLPPLCSFYSYATVRPKEAAAAAAAACAPAELVAPQVLVRRDSPLIEPL